MAKSKIPHKPIPAEEREMTESQAPSISAEAEIEEEERFDKDFWSRVIHLLIARFVCFLYVARCCCLLVLVV